MKKNVLKLQMINSKNINRNIRFNNYTNFCSNTFNSSTSERKYLETLFDYNVKNLKTPAFKFYSSQIEILKSPSEFYLSLIKLIREAKYRITISSLYLGNGKLEKYLVDELKKKVQQNSKFKITILLDYSRGLRGINNSKKMLQPLLNQTAPYIGNVKICLFNHPDIPIYYSVLPKILSEIKGVLHSKVLIFDNNVILTGANMSDSYFTNRLDRYWIFQQHEPFSDYCDDYVNSLSQNSSIVGFDEKINEKIVNKEELLHSLKMHKYEHRVKIQLEENLDLEEYFGNLKKYNNCYINRLSEEKILSIAINAKKIIEIEHENENLKKIENTNDNFQQKINSNDNESKSNEVYVFPSLQFSSIKLNNDEELLYKLIDQANKEETKIKMVTGYFNPNRELSSKLKLIKDLEILSSSPESNSFYKAGGIKSFIPFFYRKQLRKFDSSKEYNKSDWTFHCKGIFFYNNKNLPFLSTIGSSNYNYRFFVRDVEAQFYVFSNCDKFNQVVNEEVKEMFENSDLLKEKPLNAEEKGVKAYLTSLFLSLFKKFF